MLSLALLIVFLFSVVKGFDTFDDGSGTAESPMMAETRIDR